MNNIGKMLEGKVAIITGAASGIGEAVARIYCENRCKVLGVDFDAERLARIAARSRPPAATSCRWSPTSPASKR